MDSISISRASTLRPCLTCPNCLSLDTEWRIADATPRGGAYCYCRSCHQVWTAEPPPSPTVKKVDRRDVDRLTVHPCDHCETDHYLSAVSRTDNAVYFRCGQCGHVFSMRKPKTS